MGKDSIGLAFCELRLRLAALDESAPENNNGKKRKKKEKRKKKKKADGFLKDVLCLFTTVFQLTDEQAATHALSATVRSSHSLARPSKFIFGILLNRKVSQS